MRLLCEDVINTPGSATAAVYRHNNNSINNNSSSSYHRSCSGDIATADCNSGGTAVVNGAAHFDRLHFLNNNNNNSTTGDKVNKNNNLPSSSSMSTSAASSILTNFLMLNPLNPDFKKIYFSMLPKVVAEALDNGSSLDDCRKVLSCFAANPHLNWEERRIVESIANEVEDAQRLKSNSSIGRPRAGSSAAVWGESPSALSSLVYSKARRAMSLTGSEDVFSRMKTFRCDTADDPLQPQKSTFNEPSSGMKDVPSWLKSLRLHKYSPLFAQMTYDDMMKLSEEMLEAKGVTVGARRKIILSIQKLKDRVSFLNQLEKDLIDVSRVPSTLTELRAMIGTPVKPKRVDDPDNEDIPVFFTETLVKACSYLLSSPINSNGTLDDDCFSMAVHVIDKCLCHEAFMPPQKKRLASLKQEIRRLWSPRHHRRFSLQNNFPLHQHQPNCNGAFVNCSSLHKDRRSNCDLINHNAHTKCFNQATPNPALFLSSLAQQLTPSTSNDIVNPLINLFRQHCNVQNLRQNLQRTTSAPLWNSNIFSGPPSRDQQQRQSNGGLLNGHNFNLPPQHQQPTTNNSSTTTTVSNLVPPSPPQSNNNQLRLSSQQQQQRAVNDPVPSFGDTFTSSGLVAGSPVAATSGAGSTYSPWTSFYSGLQRSAWSCGIEDIFNSHQQPPWKLSTGSTLSTIVNSTNGNNDATYSNSMTRSSVLPPDDKSNANSGGCSSFFKCSVKTLTAAAPALKVPPVNGTTSSSSGSSYPVCSTVAASNGNMSSNCVGISQTANGAVVGSFGEYSGIDQLARSMIESIDC